MGFLYEGILSKADATILPYGICSVQVKKRPFLQSIIFLFLVCSILGFSGCRSNHSLTYKNETPQQNVLRITTQDGEVITFILNDEIDPQVLIALQTTFANYAILKAELIQGELQHQQRQDNFKAFVCGLLTLNFLALLVAVTVIVVKVGGKNP